jgi:hypothetical protein
VEAYLTESRKAVDRIYQLRYSDLLRVFSFLLRDDWLEEADLIGLQPEKIADIKRSAEGLLRMPVSAHGKEWAGGLYSIRRMAILPTVS